jgi:hypothetical protein
MQVLRGTVTRRALLRGVLAGMAAAGLSAAGVNASGGIARAAPGRGAAPQALPVWLRLARSEPNPPARRDHSLTLDRERSVAYLFGGRRQEAALGDVWMLDLQSGVWSEVVAVGTAPPPRWGHNATWDASGKRLVVALGQAENATFFDDVWAFGPSSAAWSLLGAGSSVRPAARYGAGDGYDPAANRLLITHGFTFQGRFDDTWAFDLAADAWSQLPTGGTLPEPRCLTRAFWEPTGGQLLLYGGQSNTTPFLGDFWSLDPSIGIWSQQPTPPPGARNLYAAGAQPIGSEWYVFGGRTPNGLVADTWAYQAATQSWLPIAAAADTEAPSARHGPQLAATPEALYLFGGDDGTAEQDDTWALRFPAPAQ